MKFIFITLQGMKSNQRRNDKVGVVHNYLYSDDDGSVGCRFVVANFQPSKPLFVHKT
jgi:hypothetical protein